MIALCRLPSYLLFLYILVYCQIMTIPGRLALPNLPSLDRRSLKYGALVCLLMAAAAGTFIGLQQYGKAQQDLSAARGQAESSRQRIGQLETELSSVNAQIEELNVKVSRQNSQLIDYENQLAAAKDQAAQAQPTPTPAPAVSQSSSDDLLSRFFRRKN